MLAFARQNISQTISFLIDLMSFWAKINKDGVHEQECLILGSNILCLLQSMISRFNVLNHILGNKILIICDKKL
jgi:hypothetical protein